jgi:putative phosphoesterase
MSDSHDNIWNMRKAVAALRAKGAELIIHCGDFVAPFMLKELAAAELPVHGVFGNNDGDRYLLTRTALTEFKNITLHGPLFGTITADGARLAFSHYREAALGLAADGQYEAVFFGHSHVHEHFKTGNTLVLNPGEIMGKDGSPGFVVMDTSARVFGRVELV